MVGNVLQRGLRLEQMGTAAEGRGELVVLGFEARSIDSLIIAVDRDAIGPGAFEKSLRRIRDETVVGISALSVRENPVQSGGLRAESFGH